MSHKRIKNIHFAHRNMRCDRHECNKHVSTFFIFLCFHVHKNSQINHFNPIFKRGKFWGVTKSARNTPKKRLKSLFFFNKKIEIFIIPTLDSHIRSPCSRRHYVGECLRHTVFMLLIVIYLPTTLCACALIS